MLFHQVHNTAPGAGEIAAHIETAILRGELIPGARLPAIRHAAVELGVSPATVAAGYRTLRERGLVTADGRRGTLVAIQPPLRIAGGRPLPPNTRDLASGNPDRALLPCLEPAIAKLDPRHKLYGGPMKLSGLVRLAEADFGADEIIGDIAIVSGALDGIERVLQTQLRPGDSVVVEDPSWPRISDLLRALGFRVLPVGVDQRGLLPDELGRALRTGAKAVIATPRGQNPTGAAVDADRAARILEVLERHPEVLVVEDDYMAAVAGAPYISLHGASARWAVIRSLSKVLGPDLRMATMAGDSLTISRVEGRQVLGVGWASHLLQQMAAQVWSSASTKRLLARAERTYAVRREALIEALACFGITAYGRSGLGVWVPVSEEAATVQMLAERGWAVSPGERYRFRAQPGIRITTADLLPKEARRLGADFQTIMTARHSTYIG